MAITEVKNELKDLDQRERARAEAAGGTSLDTEEVVDRKKRGWEDILKLRPEDVDERWNTRNLGLAIIPPNLHKQLSEAQIEQVLTSNQLLELLGGGWMVQPMRKGAVRARHGPPEVTTGSLRELTLKKLLTLELSVAKLVLRFLVHLSSEQDQELPQGRIPQNIATRAAMSRHNLLLKIDIMNRYLRRLRHNGKLTEESTPDWPASPAYKRDSLSSDDQKSLNAALCSIFEEHAHSKNYALMLKKICSNLLVAPSPPDVTTYNLLIAHLTRLEQNDLVRMVLESFDESHVRPNEITISATLKFYTVSNDKQGFRSYANRFRGRKGGLALARPNIRITAAAEGRLIRRNGKVIQEAPKSIQFFGALMNGTLKFFGVKQGMKVYYEMLSEGWEPNIHILSAILRRCHLRRDWAGGYAVWRHIKESSAFISDRAYIWMLQLCRVCKRVEVYDEIVQELNSQGIFMGLFQRCSTDEGFLLQTDIQQLRKMMQKQRREAVKDVKAIEEVPASDLVEDAYDDEIDAAATVLVNHMATAEAIKAGMQNTRSKTPATTSHRSFPQEKGSQNIPAADVSREQGKHNQWEWPIGQPTIQVSAPK